MARALYSRNPLIILDDVLTGLDRQTEASVLEAVFGAGGVLKNTKSTVVLATNSGNVIRLRSRYHAYLLNTIQLAIFVLPTTSWSSTRKVASLSKVLLSKFPRLAAMCSDLQVCQPLRRRGRSCWSCRKKSTRNLVSPMRKTSWGLHAKQATSRFMRITSKLLVHGRFLFIYSSARLTSLGSASLVGVLESVLFSTY